MKGNILAYMTWAPDESRWSKWAKPVLFADMTHVVLDEPDIPERVLDIETVGSTAVIVDLPGKDGVLAGLALARKGYRPVPLYNGVLGQGEELVPVRDIVRALLDGTAVLRGLDIKADAPPAFLLDASRMSGWKQPGAYDNRWSVFPQDMPSAAYLIENGIDTVILLSASMQEDLRHILYRYDHQGIKIFTQDGGGYRRERVGEPAGFMSVFYRFQVMMGLRRNPAGGFGGMIPLPQDTEGGGHYGRTRYHRIG